MDKSKEEEILEKINWVKHLDEKELPDGEDNVSGKSLLKVAGLANVFDVLDLLVTGFSRFSEITVKKELNSQQVYNALRNLLKAGLVKEEEKGYIATKKGLKAYKLSEKMLELEEEKRYEDKD